LAHSPFGTAQNEEMSFQTVIKYEKHFPLPGSNATSEPGNDNFNLFCLFQTMIGVETEKPEGLLNKPVSGFL